jgi:hypothetical protein
VKTDMRRWAVPTVGLAIGLLVAWAGLWREAGLLQVLVAFGIVAAYSLALFVLQPRSETASLLSGLPVDERWEAINRSALALAAQMMAVILAIAFVAVQFGGGDARPYALMSAAFAASYFGGIMWYRWRK